jgi:hypothetical protein
MERMWLVVSRGGLNASSGEKPQWFSDYGDAWLEVKRRLGVASLHRRKRGNTRRYIFRDGEDRQFYDGTEWRADSAEDFSAVPTKHRDFGNSGGLTVYEMVRIDPIQT